MRRKDREVKDLNEIKEIINDSDILHLGLFDEQYPYIVPMHFGYEFIEEQLVFYMHCAKEGHKLDLIKRNKNACIQIENSVSLVSGGDDACEYSSTFASIIARGEIEVLMNPEEKVHALKCIMYHQTQKEFEMNEQMAASVEVLRFVSDSYSAKMKRK